MASTPSSDTKGTNNSTERFDLYYAFFVYVWQDAQPQSHGLKLELYAANSAADTVNILVSSINSSIKVRCIFNKATDLYTLFSKIELMENDLQPEDSTSASPLLQQPKSPIDRNFDVYPTLNSSSKLEDLFQQLSQDIPTLVADKKGRQRYLITKSEYLPDTELTMENKRLINDVYAKLKAHLKTVSEVDPDIVVCPIDVCTKCSIPKAACEGQLEKLFPGTYNGRLSELLLQIIELHRSSQTDSALLNDSAVRMLKDMDLFLDKVREFNNLGRINS